MAVDWQQGQCRACRPVWQPPGPQWSPTAWGQPAGSTRQGLRRQTAGNHCVLPSLVVRTTLGIPGHPPQTGRAASQRLSAEAQEAASCARDTGDDRALPCSACMACCRQLSANGAGPAHMLTLGPWRRCLACAGVSVARWSLCRLTRRDSYTCSRKGTASGAHELRQAKCPCHHASRHSAWPVQEARRDDRRLYAPILPTLHLSGGPALPAHPSGMMSLCRCTSRWYTDRPETRPQMSAPSGHLGPSDTSGIRQRMLLSSNSQHPEPALSTTASPAHCAGLPLLACRCTACSTSR